MRPVLSDIQSIFITSSIAVVTGFVFKVFDMPAPFLLGSLFGVWVIGGVIPPMRSRVGIPRWIHVPVILGLGTLIGATFRPSILAEIGSSGITVAAMLLATILATIVGLFYLMRIRRYSFIMALLSCIPGGQAEVVSISRDLVKKDYVVALFHLVRVAVVFCSTPFILALVEGQAAVAASNLALRTMPSIINLDIKTLLSFVAISIFGLPLARLLHIPVPQLIGPLIVSSALHILGFIEIPRISEFVILAQIAIGGSVGARLARVPFVEIAVYLRDALVNSFIVLGTYGITAYGLSAWTGVDFIKMLLAFVPGGLYEVTLLALIFGFDVAFVALHHTIRVMLVFFGLPFIVTFAKKHNFITDNVK